jgi:DNA modification methylase
MKPHYQKDGITVYCGDLRDVLPTLPSTLDYVVTDPPYGLKFMGKDWDHEVPGPDYWQAIDRVCKPGASLLAFGGTKTHHRLTCAIEDAGWEIRDCLMWLHGQGMPKCGDIGKMIDKSKGAVREVVGSKLGLPGYSLANHGRTNEVYGDLHNPAAECAITAPATPEAALWTGWAMALKPAWEPIILAMKPLDGTIANNALTHNVAGLNIDACRIPAPDGVPVFVKRNEGSKNVFHDNLNGSNRTGEIDTTGRWPANLLVDEETATMLGGASRFFYCGKAAKKERGPGNDHPTVKPLALMKYLLTLCSSPTGGLILDPFAGSGSTLLAARALGRQCIGIELDPHYCDIIVSRLEGEL